METVFGLNSISRGQVNTDMSGKAMGLLQSMSIQYASAFQQSYAETAEELGTFILQLIQSFAKTERMASIVGKFNKMDMVKFTGDDISGVERVVVDLQNPYLATTQGRDEVATRMLEAGFFKDNPQQYLVFRETGNYEVMTQAPMSKMSLVTAENEDLQQGKPVIIAMSDPHLLHIQEHLTLVSRPDIRRNSQYLELIMNHVQEHYNLYNTQPPIFAQINGEPPSPMSQMMPPPVPGAEPPPGPQQGNPEPVHQEPVPAPPQPDQALEQSLR